MRSTSRSRGSRRSLSRDRNNTRRETNKFASKRPRSKSRSPPSHGPAGRRQSSDASDSPKRRRSSAAGSNKVARREADSTVFAKKRQSSPSHQNIRQPKARSRTPKHSRKRNAKPGEEDRHTSHSRRSPDNLRNKHEERGSKHHAQAQGESGDGKSGTDNKHARKGDHETLEPGDSHKMRSYDQTDITMDDRFSKLSLSTKPFVPDENISIEIERTVDGRSIPFEYPKFFSDAIVLLRHSNEGKKPLSDREEFKQRVDDEEERRTVKVTKSTAHETFNTSRSNSDSRQHRRGDHHEKESSHLGGDHGRDARGRKGNDRRSYEDAKDLVVSMRRDDTGGRNRRTERSVMTASAVGRQYLLPAAAVLTGELPLNPLRQQPTHQVRESAKSRLGAIQQDVQTYRASAVPAQLPDFSHRPDKYRYEEWKDRPELIPRSGSYYEHDDRERFDNSRFRGRGRGGRGRGGWSRGGGFDRPRGPPRQPVTQMDCWKHDKFEEMECAPGQQ